mmetsp:Transcript_33033/g.65397  ORF Transcript_33033/g.65397 Transcript_33033/m.65397 type:complete len:81 (+) Transcript_33033:215-457(+)
MGHHEKALVDAELCMALRPDFVKGIFRKGVALHAMGRYEEALPVLVGALRMEPKNSQIKQALQFCEVKMAKERARRREGR